MYDLTRLRILREVHLRGTLAAAAEALALDPSTVSHQLRRLERETGVRLTEPVGRGVRLTPESLVLVRHTESILEHLARAEAEIAAGRDTVRGHVRLATFQTAAHTIVPEALAALRAAHPDLTVSFRHLEVEEALPALLAHDFDLVLQEEYPDRPRRRATGAVISPIGADRLWLVGPVTDEEDGRTRPADLAALDDHDWVMEPLGTHARAWARAECHRAGFEPRVTFETSDMLLHLRLASSAARTVAFVPALALEAGENATGNSVAGGGASGGDTAGSPWRLGRLPGDPHRTVSVAFRRGSDDSPALTAVREALTAAMVRRGLG